MKGHGTLRVSRRSFLPAAAATALAPTVARGADPGQAGLCTPTIPPYPTPERPPPQRNWLDFSHAEVELAFRNHGMLEELLSYPITPRGGHYLLVHFDIPRLSEDGYTVAIGGRVQAPRKLALSEIKSRQAINQVVTMECAGAGRHKLSPRPVYVPWGDRCIGTYQWTGTPLAPLLQQAGLLDDAVEVLFTGWDSGVDLGVEHAFERSLPVADAMHPEVMLAWAANGEPLSPEHGFPLRLVVPSWYGMASVKWLRAITVLNEPFKGVQQEQVYRYTRSADDPGEPVREKRVRSVMLPPGIPDLQSRWRFVAPGEQMLQGMAWSGNGPVAAVEVSLDGGGSWSPARLSPVSNDPFAWVQWQAPWSAKEGMYSLMCRATDARGATQPLDPSEVWNYQGNGINSVQQVQAVVQDGVGSASAAVPSTPRLVLQGGKLPERPGVANEVASL